MFEMFNRINPFVTLILLVYCCCQHPLQLQHQGCCLYCNDQRRVRCKRNKRLIVRFDNLKLARMHTHAHTAGYLRTEVVLTLHNTCRFLPSISTTSFCITSSRLGTSSVGPVCSTCLNESDLERDYSPLEKSLSCWSRNVWGEQSWAAGTSVRGFHFSLVDGDEASGGISVVLPVFVLAEAGLHPWSGFGSNPPQCQAIQARVWERSATSLTFNKDLLVWNGEFMCLSLVRLRHWK